MRLHRSAELGQVSLVALAVEQRPTELLLQQLDGTCQRRLGDVALLGGAGEVESLAQRDEVTGLVHFHRRRSSSSSNSLSHRSNWSRTAIAEAYRDRAH